MRHSTLRLLRELQARRARERSIASRFPGTPPVFGGWSILCPVCAHPVVLRLGPRGLRYYCACTSSLRDQDSHAPQCLCSQDCSPFLPSRSFEQGEGIATKP